MPGRWRVVVVGSSEALLAMMFVEVVEGTTIGVAIDSTIVAEEIAILEAAEDIPEEELEDATDIRIGIVTEVHHPTAAAARLLVETIATKIGVEADLLILAGQVVDDTEDLATVPGVFHLVEEAAVLIATTPTTAEGKTG